MKVEVKVTKKEAMPKHPFFDKWKVNGRVRVNEAMDKATVEMETVVGATRPPIKRLCELHERGHVLFFEDRLDNEENLTARDFVKCDVFFVEVDAWLRALNGRDIGYIEGTFILDCLNSYRRGYNVPDEVWQEAKDLVAEHGSSPLRVQRLRQYIPLEPLPNDPAPRPFEFEGYDYDEPDTDDEKAMKAREEWLLSPEGMAAAKRGNTDHLMDALRKAGHKAEGPLPIVTAKWFAKHGGALRKWK